MPVRAWSLVAALGLAFASAAIADPPEQYRAERQREQDADPEDDQTQAVEDTRPAWLNWLDRRLGIEGCGPYPVDRLGRADQVSESQYYADCDLEAQESVANSTRWLLALAVPQLVLTIFGTLLVWRSLNFNKAAIAAAHEGTKVAREIGEAQVRAYVSLVSEKDSIVVEEFDFYSVPVVRFHIKNSGSSPALNLRYSAVLLSMPNDFAGSRGDLAYLPREGPERSETLSAGDVLIARTNNARRWNDEVMKRLVGSEWDQKVILYGRITYDDVFGKARQTRFCLQMTIIHYGDELDNALSESGTLSEYEWAKTAHHNDAT